MQQISIGSDHAGYKFKELIINYLRSKSFTVNDQGAFSEESVDYPDFAHKVASDVNSGKADIGILCCGSGNGVAMAANKHKGVRAALCWQPEIASLAVRHNNANILCLPARFISEEEAFMIIDSFLEASFEGGRHERRVEKIEC
jgi:ribose 5-phosphate isomerase B